MTDALQGATIIFDLDGTLVDTAADLAASMNYALRKRGLPAAPAQDVRHLVGHGARRMLMRGFEVAGRRQAGDAELDAALSDFLEYYEAHIAAHSRPFDGAIELIENRRAMGAKCAICTNKREKVARLLIETLGLGALFETIVGADTTSAAKPDPAPVRLCLERTNAQRAVFIGDSDTDIRAAKAAALDCYIASFGYGPVTLGSQAVGVFSHYN
ncbi:MAG: HAD-IA family hydrolase, partial [Hyphococcus sp.]